MDAEQPVAAMPTDGHAAGIFDELLSAQQLSAGGATLGKRQEVPGHLAYSQTCVINYIPSASVESLSIKLDTVLEVMHLMQLSFPSNDEHSISTLSRESIV